MTTTAAIICTRRTHALAERARDVIASSGRNRNVRIVGHGETWHVVRDLQLYDLDPETGVPVVRTVTYTGPEARA